jgi:hypothetical protein
MLSTEVLRQIARSESLAVISEKLGEVYEYITKMTPKLPHF